MKAIILDIDGTLLDSMAIDNDVYFRTIREVLGPVEVRALEDYEHVTDSGVLMQILEDNGHPADADVMAEIKSLFIEGLKQHVADAGAFPVIDGAVQFVERLRGFKDTHLAIATGCWRDSAVLKLESSGFDIDGIPLATSDDAVSRVGIMRHALAGAGREPLSVTYFGDGEWDIRACRELGWDFVAVGPDLDGIESYDDFSFPP